VDFRRARSLRRMSSHTRLLLNEVVARWSELSLVDVVASKGNRLRLVELLRAQYGFSQNCAEREVDTVLADFAERLQRAKAAGNPMHFSKL
jgi:hypothetical protein